MVSCKETMRNAVMGATTGGLGATWLASQKDLRRALEQGKTTVHNVALNHFSKPNEFEPSTGRPSSQTVGNFYRDLQSQGYTVRKSWLYGLAPKPELTRRDQHSSMDVVARELRLPSFTEVLAARWCSVPGERGKSFDRVLVDAGYSIRPTWGHLSHIVGKAASSGLARTGAALGVIGGAFWGVWGSGAAPFSR
jgi:hypothetical protein